MKYVIYLMHSVCPRTTAHAMPCSVCMMCSLQNSFMLSVPYFVFCQSMYLAMLKAAGVDQWGTVDCIADHPGDNLLQYCWIYIRYAELIP